MKTVIQTEILEVIARGEQAIKEGRTVPQAKAKKRLMRKKRGVK